MNKKNSKKLRVCLVTKRFPLLGQAATHGFLWPVSKGLAQEHDVTVLAYKNPEGRDCIQEEGITAFYLGHSYESENFPFIVDQKFKELHTEKPFDIVHSLDGGGIQIGLKKRQYSVAMVYGIEAIKLSQIFSMMGVVQESLRSFIRTGLMTTYIFLKNYYGGDRKLLKTADGVFITSLQERIALERHYLYPELKTFMVPYGIEIYDLSLRGKPEELRRKLGLPAHAQRVVTVTDMSGFAEMDVLLRAFEKVAIKKRSARLIIIGEGPYFKQIERLTLDLALSSRVTFVGSPSHTELLDYISLADAFVKLNSRVSGIDPSMIEAMAQKRVVVCSKFSPVASLLDNGIDGFFLSPTDVRALFQLLMDILGENVAVEEIGERARRKVMGYFDPKKMVEQTIIAYEKAIQTKGFSKWVRELFPL